MPDWLFHLPLTAAGCIAIASICGFSLAGVAITRRFIWEQLMSD